MLLSPPQLLATNGILNFTTLMITMNTTVDIEGILFHSWRLLQFVGIRWSQLSLYTSVRNFHL